MSPEKSFNWREHVACSGLDPDLFFPESEKEAKVIIEEVCDYCSVQDHCLEHAIRTKENEGVWGGTIPRERKIIIRLREIGS